MNLHAAPSDFHAKHFLVPCQRGFRRRSCAVFIFFSNRLSSPVLVLPPPPHSHASLSVERLWETDLMRQVHAGRETEAVPRSGAAVNKVRNNQVRVGPRLSEGAPPQQPPRQRNNTSPSSLEITSSFFPSPYLESALISSPHSSAFFSPLCLFFCLFVLVPVSI